VTANSFFYADEQQFKQTNVNSANGHIARQNRLNKIDNRVLSTINPTDIQLITPKDVDLG